MNINYTSTPAYKPAFNSRFVPNEILLKAFQNSESGKLSNMKKSDIIEHVGYLLKDGKNDVIEFTAEKGKDGQRMVQMLVNGKRNIAHRDEGSVDAPISIVKRYINFEKDTSLRSALDTADKTACNNVRDIINGWCAPGREIPTIQKELKDLEADKNRIINKMYEEVKNAIFAK